MFKGLRDRLKGVSEKLEDELEAQLEAQLEEELAAALAKDKADADAGSEDPAEAAALAKDKADADAAAQGEPEPSGDDEAAPEAPATPRGEPDDAVDDVSQEEEAPEAGESGAGDHADEEEPQESPAEESSDDEAPEAPPKPTPPPAAAPVQTPPTPAPAKPKAPIMGRKQFTAEEIQARLDRELQEALEVQKEVETVAQQSTRATRFTINEQVLDDILWELELALLESDVAMPVVEAIKDSVREQLLSMAVGGRSANEVVEKVLRAAVKRVLRIGQFDFDSFIRDRIDAGKAPIVVMFVGVNGTGKTTSIARVAHRLKQQGISCVMAAGDTFRAGAIEQLSQHGDKLGIKVVKHSAGADPAAVAYDAIEHAKARNKSVVLLDTAGRMQTNTNLMDEMDKIRRVANPALTIFVGDSLAGNDAVEQARQFDRVVDVDGAILTKTDVDAKGGAALSVAYTINKPLLFIGVGQDYGDLEPFDADVMVDRLFGKGDED